MVALQQVVNVEEMAGQSEGVVCIPEGKYPAMIVDSTEKETRKGGKMIVFKFVITSGPHQGAELTENVNIVNDNPEAVRIGLRSIANMGKAVGLQTINDTAQLHKKPIVVEIKNKQQDDWTNSNGELVKGALVSEIKRYHPVPSSGAQDVPFLEQTKQSVAPKSLQPQNDAVSNTDNPFAIS